MSCKHSKQTHTGLSPGNSTLSFFIGGKKLQGPLYPPFPVLFLFLIIESDALALFKCGNSHFSAAVQTHIDSSGMCGGANQLHMGNGNFHGSRNCSVW